MNAPKENNIDHGVSQKPDTMERRDHKACMGVI